MTVQFEALCLFSSGEPKAKCLLGHCIDRRVLSVGRLGLGVTLVPHIRRMTECSRLFPSKGMRGHQLISKEIFQPP